MIKILRTDSDNEDFKALVKLLDADLAKRDGADHSFYAQFNKIDKIKHTVVAYLNNPAGACGANKGFNLGGKEIKPMFPMPEWPNKRLASKISSALEDWAAE